jgi:hypothetical protein
LRAFFARFLSTPNPFFRELRGGIVQKKPRLVRTADLRNRCCGGRDDLLGNSDGGVCTTPVVHGHYDTDSRINVSIVAHDVFSFHSGIVTAAIRHDHPSRSPRASIAGAYSAATAAALAVDRGKHQVARGQQPNNRLFDARGAHTQAALGRPAPARCASNIKQSKRCGCFCWNVELILCACHRLR